MRGYADNASMYVTDLESQLHVLVLAVWNTQPGGDALFTDLASVAETHVTIRNVGAGS